MMTNLTRQLREVGMEDRLDEIVEEVVRVRKDFGYPPMATPYSQIVGAQAADNVISGERYKQLTDATIKYVLGYYGESAGPIDQNLKDKVMNVPRTKAFLDWQPANYLKSVEELRKEIGPGLSDDDLLLRLLIPGQPLKRGEPKKEVKRPAASVSIPDDFPKTFSVDVDGEVFRVTISPAPDGTGGAAEAETREEKGPKEVPPGAVLSGMAGLVLSFEVKVGDAVNAGDLLAMIEAMKMRRHLNAPHGGVVTEICVPVGEIVSPDDILLVVA
jgi:biotin carboxyl carrier protein